MPRLPALPLSLAACLLICLSGVQAETSLPSSPEWTLVWSDEFTGRQGTPPNPKFWNHDVGNRDTGGWGNRELQFYTASPRNARLDGQGHLEIRAETAQAKLPCWNDQPCRYTSARLTTKGKVEFVHGKIEARIQVPAGQGLWPAFWSLGPGEWPDGGEIDIMEWVGHTPNLVYGTVHGPGYSDALGISRETDLGHPASGNYHTYTLIKRPDEIVWLLDGRPYQRVTPANLPAGTRWVFEQPFSLLLNLAVGGTWPGTPPATTVFPSSMLVDYVRIWREAGK
ncbi:glycoside hydrolase family 16 protein [Deinococcus hopiensis]|uniref:Beta-glucanase, GH16 family n=1 Tax=Deinococcus hopiensis KR-140 TaxID=695939 RepID=A0A1W1UHF4_9DEIO|nr:glycoside hydrolase family 16 protein [Deinococcus hopiensis]SMB80536.1 Beta-glucanase, GH16 family [Deinococcus hopiensis KR-140]